MNLAVLLAIIQLLLVTICVYLLLRQVGVLARNKSKMLKNKTVFLDIGTVALIIIYSIVNIGTVWGCLDASNVKLLNNLSLKAYDIAIKVFGREKGCDLIWDLEFTSCWFAEKFRNIIFFIIVTVLIIISGIKRKKDNKLNKVLFVYYLLSFIFMSIIAFYASPKFLTYFYDLGE